MTQIEDRNMTVGHGRYRVPSKSDQSPGLSIIRPLVIPEDRAAQIDQYARANPESFQYGRNGTISPQEWAELRRLAEARDSDPIVDYPERYKALVRSVIDTAFAEDQITLADLTPYRVKVVWRVIREMCIIRGIIDPGESLSAGVRGLTSRVLDARNYDPWTMPVTNRLDHDYQRLNRHTPAEIAQYVVDALNLPIEQQGAVHDHNGSVIMPQPMPTPKGLSVLPPNPPVQWRDELTGQLVAHYNPHYDRALLLWIEAFKATAKYLCIQDGSELDPEYGRYGLQGMFEPELIRMCCPMPHQLIAFERLMSEEITELIVKYPILQVHKILRQSYGFTNDEIRSLVQLTRHDIDELARVDIEHARSQMILKLEDYIHRARNSLQLRSELMGMKALAAILGLNDTQLADQNTDIIEAIRQVAAGRSPVNPVVSRVIPQQMELIETVKTRDILPPASPDSTP